MSRVSLKFGLAMTFNTLSSIMSPCWEKMYPVLDRVHVVFFYYNCHLCEKPYFGVKKKHLT